MSPGFQTSAKCEIRGGAELTFTELAVDVRDEAAKTGGSDIRRSHTAQEEKESAYKPGSVRLAT